MHKRNSLNGVFTQLFFDFGFGIFTYRKYEVKIFVWFSG